MNSGIAPTMCRQKRKLGLLVLLALLPSLSCRAEDTVYDYSLVKATGGEVSLATYKGKVLLFVNLARNSIFSDQTVSLEKIYEAYKDKGLVVIGIPANDFGAEEPGSDAEVAKTYSDLHLGFTVAARGSVRGKDQLPLYKFLTAGKDKSLGGEVHWNFSKFLVDRNGQVVARFPSDDDPSSPHMRMVIEKVLAGTYKRPDNQKDASSNEGDEDDDSER